MCEQDRAQKAGGEIVCTKKTCRRDPGKSFPKSRITLKKTKKAISKRLTMKKGDKKLTFIARTVLKQVVKPNDTIGTGAEIA